jgi:PHD/YefM family antitoxin component YafN of YafNO toxin-antitoxin module
MVTTTLKQINISKKDTLPAVVIPLSQYERMREDLDMFRSKSLLKEIKKSRNEIKKGETILWTDLKKKLKLMK